jgi:hypothetical protein
MTTVVNLRNYPGKGMERVLPEGVVRVDRWSKWGNPFKIGRTKCDHPDCVEHYYHITREKSLRAYRDWLKGMLRVDPAFLEPLRGKTLACWCKPLDCHADIIAEYLDEPTGR